jgi:nucleotide-binding universal stress UspA family protein
MIAKILVAYDGSCQAQKAFEFGLEMAAKYGASMTVLSIARPPEPPVNVELQAVLEHATQYFESHFTKMKVQATEAGIETVFDIRVGHPAEQIVYLSEELKVDAIVMGHRGESLFQK